MIDVYVETLREDITLPFYANPYDAGMDVCAAEDVMIKPGETVIIPTGLKFAIPEGYEIQVRPRSGISYRTPLRISNSPGTIDAGYRDELGIIMTNTSPEINKEDNSEISGDNKEIFTLDTKGNKKGIYLIKKGRGWLSWFLPRYPG